MEFRSLDPADLDAAIDIRNRSFGLLSADDYEVGKTAATRAIEAGRAIGAYDGPDLVAAARIHDLTQWWNGRTVRLAGVAGVVVRPEARGRGVGAGLMTAVLHRADELGYPLSALYPATVPPYRRVGYEVAGAEYKITIAPEVVRTLAPGSDVKLHRPTSADADAVAGLVAALHERHRDCGPIGWSTVEWADELDDLTNFSYLAEDGFLMYGWGGDGGLIVHTLVGGSEETIRALWSVVGSGSSVAKTINTVIAPHDPIRWLLRDKGLVDLAPVWWMLRLVDAQTAFQGRGYPAGLVVDVPIELSDPQLPGHTDRFRLTVADGSAHLEPDRSRADAVRLSANGAAALYAGTPMSTLRRTGLATGGGLEADASLDAAFAARPYMLDYF